MSIKDRRNDTHLELHPNVGEHLRKSVYRLRVEVHNLRAGEDGEREGKSENHVTFAMMLGNDESVRVDMGPSPTTNLGKMVVRYRDDIVSNKTLRLTDINALGCSDNFDPSRDPEPWKNRVARCSVDQVLCRLVNGNMHRYRFMYIDSQPLGCRYWIKSVLGFLRESGYLRHDVNFDQGNDGHQSLNRLLAHQWDRRQDQGVPVSIVPGLFLRTQQASFLNEHGLLQVLQGANLHSHAMKALATMMDRRTVSELLDGFKKFLGAMNRLPQALANARRTFYLKEFARLATLEGFEGMAAQDLATAAGTREPTIVQMLGQLYTCLRGRYSDSQTAMVGAQRTQGVDKLIYMLVAVCGMAGDEDEDEDEEEDEDD